MNTFLAAVISGSAQDVMLNLRFLVSKRPLFFLFLLIMLGILLLISFKSLIPRGMAFYRQMTGGRILEGVIEAASNNKEAFLACELPPVSSKTERRLLKQAVRHLVISRNSDPTSSHTYLLLGQARCMLGETEKAVNALIQYTLLRPDNPLGFLELGFAYDTLCGLPAGSNDPIAAGGSLPQSACTNPEVRQAVISAWKQAGVDVEAFYISAENAFANKDYADAESWYRSSLRYGQLPAENTLRSTVFKWAVSAVLAGHSLPPETAILFPLSHLSDGITIEEDHLYWLLDNSAAGLEYGDSISKFRFPEKGAGALFWQGSTAGFVDVQITGIYKITLRAKNTLPAPVLIQTEVNLNPVDRISLEKSDNSWEEFSTFIKLQQGPTLIGISFLNNAVVNGIDRDAVIDWIKIEKVLEN